MSEPARAYLVETSNGQLLVLEARLSVAAARRLFEIASLRFRRLTTPSTRLPNHARLRRRITTRRPQ